jgi:hypothetical protein
VTHEASAPGTLKFRGDAYDLATRRCHSENHSEFYKDGKHAYSRIIAAGKEFASKIITSLPSHAADVRAAMRDGYIEGINAMRAPYVRAAKLMSR